MSARWPRDGFVFPKACMGRQSYQNRSILLASEVKHTHAITLLTILFLCTSFPVFAADPRLQFSSETILYSFERENQQGNSIQSMPLYEYMRMDYGDIDNIGLSLHAHGWARKDIADNGFYEDDTDGELLYGYVEYVPPSSSSSIKIGRQHIFSGIVNDSVDGLGLESFLGAHASVTAFAGFPTAYKEDNGTSGDAIFGGRTAFHDIRLGTMGISYKKVSDDGDTVENTAGLDTYLMVTGFLTCQGLSSWNFESRGWREHTYEAVLVLDEFLLKAMYQAYRFDDYFSEDDTGSQPFRYLKDTDEKVSVVGGDMVWQQSGIVDVGIKLKQYTYDVRDETSRNVTAVLNVHGDKNSQAGLEIGIMDGETSENEYTLMRGYFYWDTPMPITENWYVSGNLLYVRYDEDIYGEDSSLFMSLGGGKQIIENSLQLNVSGDYSSDPYFDKDFRLMIALKYDY